jgi:tRNA(fMet)-specific endonuclease VapC
MMHLDTSFLIDLLRESARGRPGPALDFIEAVDDRETIGVSVHVLCELLAGVELSRNPKQEIRDVTHLSGAIEIAYPDERFAPAYGRLLASMQRMGSKVATMDLLIATAAVLDDAPLVTRNVKDFSRVPGLRLLRY